MNLDKLIVELEKYIQKKDSGKVKEILSSVMVSDSNSASIYIKLAKFLNNFEEYSYAEEILLQSINRFPYHEKLLLMFADNAMSLKKWNEAIKRYQYLFSVFPDSTEKRIKKIKNAISVFESNKHNHKCNLCDCPLFEDMGKRKNVKCANCGSLERTRLLYLYLQHLNIIKKETKILHLAPERGLYRVISKIVSPENYCVADLDPKRYSFVKKIIKLDLCDDIINLPDNYYDLILHSHVFEHIPCNYTFVLYHLHRTLKPNGLHVSVIPFMDGYYDECFGPINAEEKIKRFGQSDHVRRIGKEDINKSFGLVIPIDPNYDITKYFSPKCLLFYNIPENCWKGLTINTVLILRKEDFNYNVSI